MPRHLLPCAILALVPLHSAWPQAAQPAAAVKAAEEARVAALDRSDVAALDSLLAPDLTYVHASGKVDTKISFLEAIRSGQLRYISWQPTRFNVRVEGATAVLDGEYAIYVQDKRVQPQPFHVTVFFLTVYALRDQRWQQIAWQTTRDVSVPSGR
ncbi:MAG TPA: nuclear transport factor 2 family protein [Terracidiphilus sp.]|nr:nuclear transport factor 2 family protein [Terracidiphilus sp.]